jgi:YbgC/YbaW family acyl-CoA thioester hydrolase
MFEMTRKIRMSETDATGAIYFTNQLKFATEAFEHFLETHRMFDGKHLLPIVEVTSRYFAPLMLGEEIRLSLFFQSIEETSFVVGTHIFKGDKKVGETFIKHVLIAKEERKRVSIPEPFRKILHRFLIAV